MTPGERPLFHFTHIKNLSPIIANGLRSDAAVRAMGSLQIEVGATQIKERRRRRSVPVGPGGCVGDYVPFYFATRSPMLLTLQSGNVPAYQEGQGSLIYSVSDPDHLEANACELVITDRNAALGHALFYDGLGHLDDAIDWALMNAVMWNNTPNEPDRMERRMAELLVHHRVPFAAIRHIGVLTAARRDEVLEAMASVAEPPRVTVRPRWYY